ncbi:MAG TPA: prolipoprotein diacylglyceryl transferase [Candidatus Methylomirabilis sp.]|nr:prolipoprotein diacylglyceryl transferase [Candidatus Methylomirabilis sp.]
MPPYPIPFLVHRINPQVGELFGISLWYYGLTYSLGFLGVYLWFNRAQKRLGWADREVYDLSILVALGILVCGRAVEIVFYEWSYYLQHPTQALSYWRGGMSSHGVLLGGILGIWVFSRWRGRSFLEILDEVAIPAAFLMGVGRIGNFIDGNIVGYPTDLWWAVKFPDAEGFRHPVTLYDALKNFLMIPLLLVVRRTSTLSRGVLLAHFVFWYGFGRLFVDYFRQYPVEVFGLPPGQYFNLLMAIGGLGLLIWFTRRGRSPDAGDTKATHREDTCRLQAGAEGPGSRNIPSSLWLRRLAFVALLLFPSVIPTDWTRGNVVQPRRMEQKPTVTVTDQTDWISFSPLPL